VFEQLRQSLNELLERATKPEDRRTIVVRMKNTLVQATMGMDDLRNALVLSRRKLEHEQKELQTVRRRKELAVAIKDTDTVTVAERFERQHQERLTLLEGKVAVQEREVELAERELEEMKAELRKAMTGVPPTTGSHEAAARDEVDEMLDATGGAEATRAREEIDSMARERARAERSADADRRLEELKKRMGR
jgi:hypothetical protein